MKFNYLPLVSLLLTGSAFANEHKQFNYVELSAGFVSDYDYGHLYGHGVAGQYSMLENLYLAGAFEYWTEEDFDYYISDIGIGTKFEIVQYVIPFVQANFRYGHTEDNRWDESYHGKSYILNYGVAGNISRVHYKLGINRYFYEHWSQNDNYEFAEVFVSITDWLSVGAKLENAPDETIQVGVRYNF